MGIPNPFPFPFFGAGKACYFEWVEVQIRLARLPNVQEKKRILAELPRPLAPEWSGPILTVGGEPHRGSRGIHKSYEADPGDKSGGKDEDGWFFSKDSQVRRFNEHIEQWLIQANEICPIVAALRREDSEADRRAGVVKGTAFSAWHAWSLKQATTILRNKGFDTKANHDEASRKLLTGILEMAIGAKVKLTPAQLDFADPTAQVERAIAKDDLPTLRRFLSRERQVTLEELAMPAIPAKVLIALSREILNGTLSKEIGSRLFCAALETKNTDLFKRLLTMARQDKALANGAYDAAVTLRMNQRFADALNIFDRLLEIEGIDENAYVLALWLLLRDNTRLRFDPARARRYLIHCLPHGPSLPAIFHNAACVYRELGDRKGVFENIRKAVAHKYDAIESLCEDFKELKQDPQFLSIFNTPALRRAIGSNPTE